MPIPAVAPIATMDMDKPFINWVHDGTDVTSWRIQRCTGSGCTGFATVESGIAPSFRRRYIGAIPVTAGVTYQWRVLPVGSSGTGTASNSVSARRGDSALFSFDGANALVSSMITYPPRTQQYGTISYENHVNQPCPASIADNMPVGRIPIDVFLYGCIGHYGANPFNITPYTYWISKPASYNINNPVGVEAIQASDILVEYNVQGCHAMSGNQYSYTYQLPTEGQIGRLGLLNNVYGYTLIYDAVTGLIPGPFFQNFDEIRIDFLDVTVHYWDVVDPGPIDDDQEQAPGEPCCDTVRDAEQSPGTTLGPDPVGELPPWDASCEGGGQVDGVADLTDGESWL